MSWNIAEFFNIPSYLIIPGAVTLIGGFRKYSFSSI